MNLLIGNSNVLSISPYLNISSIMFSIHLLNTVLLSLANLKKSHTCYVTDKTIILSSNNSIFKFTPNFYFKEDTKRKFLENSVFRTISIIIFLDSLNISQGKFCIILQFSFLRMIWNADAK
jgi:hypothetical protein